MGIGGFLGVSVAVSWSLTLCWFDITRRRLPNALTVPPALAGVVATLVALAVGQPQIVGALLWPGIYLASGRGVGGGDIKLAVPLGVVCAAVGGLPAVLLAIGLSGLVTGYFAAVSGSRTMPHGPSMLAAAWGAGMYFGV